MLYVRVPGSNGLSKQEAVSTQTMFARRNAPKSRQQIPYFSEGLPAGYTMFLFWRSLQGQRHGVHAHAVPQVLR